MVVSLFYSFYFVKWWLVIFNHQKQDFILVFFKFCLFVFLPTSTNSLQGDCEMEKVKHCLELSSGSETLCTKTKCSCEPVCVTSLQRDWLLLYLSVTLCKYSDQCVWLATSKGQIILAWVISIDAAHAQLPYTHYYTCTHTVYTCRTDTHTHTLCSIVYRPISPCFCPVYIHLEQ